MRTTRLMSVVAIVLGVLSVPTPAHTTPAEAAPAVAVAPEPDGDHRAGDDRRVLVDDTVRPDGRLATAARLRRWPGRTIPYFESIPAKWDWSLDQAIDHWNQAGGKIKLVEVPKSKAKLVIGYGDTGGADGVGTLGYYPHGNYVHLSPAYKKVNEHDPEQRVWVGRLFTHELGHVLGFNHTAGCSLMTPVFVFGVCPVLSADKPGYYACRWIDKPLLKRFVRLYGGKAKRPPADCLIEELPSDLRDVSFTGGNAVAKPVKVTWTPPSTVRDGTKVHVVAWPGACTSRPSGGVDVLLDPKAGSWTDTGYGKGTWCYRVQIQNRYGATRPPHEAGLARYAPVPAAPAVGPRTWDAASAQFIFSWTPPNAFTTLRAMRAPYDDPTTCPTGYTDDDAEYVDRDVDTGKWLLYAGAVTECLVLYTVTDWDTRSATGTEVVLQVPAPTATPTVGTIGPWAGDPTYAAATTVDLAPGSGTIAIEVLDGTCPAVVPSGLAWQDGYEDWDHPGTYYFYPEAYGTTQCALFTALDDYGQHGPVVKKPFTVAGP